MKPTSPSFSLILFSIQILYHQGGFQHQLNYTHIWATVCPFFSRVFVHF